MGDAEQSPLTVTLRVPSSQSPVSLTLTANSLLIKGSNLQHVPLLHVLKAHFDPESRILNVAYLAERGGKKHSPLVNIEGKVEDGNAVSTTASWAENVLQACYEGLSVERSRRLLVFVNPHGGTKKAVSIFVKVVEPIFRAAGCGLDVIYTTHQGHAYEVVKESPLEYAAIITVSGDGLIHEVINGLSHHGNPIKALSTPVAPIPAGSGNGLSLNLLGIKDGFDVGLAALNVIKGRPMKVDLFSMTQGGKRSLSFMSQALGLMADLDLGTEHLRWMGDTRFMVGLLKGIAQLKPCPIQLSFKVAETDKHKMAEHLVTSRKEFEKDNISGSLPSNSITKMPERSALPPLNYLPDDADGWTSFNEPLIYVYAGKGPYVGRDFMAFPVSLPNDGLIDVSVMPLSPRMDILAAISGAAEGENYWKSSIKYVKAHAYRVKPLKPKGNLSVDGESFPFEEFQVEVHQGLGRFLSMYGQYAVDFASQNPASGQFD
ncbi:uncharacterized protein LACBIDRAFT_306015 [Laccaria bicolor S238N-H82]|uniref:Predicted protein n=1 Tax=Laccaria bicolor (strain S238N-H82 / ATCC MYA-4686) TaxID=486041 RepID=B0CSI2_LACBS|nr:uncharacterized protein LACBIDRAFT_306015 [Laccaria bicolor S238N-H82]EDR14311.1 predicted protein [Laccaria bicolor S238N-H82]|eukprot:XP_001874870.1 predicted protein [Laccaria bicolor S238N-H82]